MRYTKAFIKARFAMAMNDLGLQHGETYTQNAEGEWKPNAGTYFLDFAAIYGGWQIRKMGDHGQESLPFAAARYSTKEFVAFLDGLMGAAFILSQKGR